MSQDISSSDDSLLESVWRSVVRTESIGAMVVAAGALLMAGTFRAEPGVSWLDPLDVGASIPAAAGLLGGALILWLALIWQRYRLSEGLDVDGEPTRQPTWQTRRLPIVGAVSAIVGLGFCIGTWFGVLGADRPGRLVMSPGQQAESFESRMAGETIDVMLPMRFRLDDLTLEPEVGIEVSFAEPGSDPFGQRRLGTNGSVSIESYRIAPIGLTTSEGRLRATVESRRDDTIPARATKGQSFKLSPDGPSYEVVDAVDNYLGAMGPAVRLSSEQTGAFWLFERAGAAEPAPDLPHQLELTGLDRVPSVVFAVTPKIPIWPVALGGSLFIFGFAVCIAFPERIRRLGDGESEPISFNEAGLLVEQRHGSIDLKSKEES
jgi:hypothetical protein